VIYCAVRIGQLLFAVDGYRRFVAMAVVEPGDVIRVIDDPERRRRIQKMATRKRARLKRRAKAATMAA
jgi:hypothetical protein